MRAQPDVSGRIYSVQTFNFTPPTSPPARSDKLKTMYNLEKNISTREGKIKVRLML